MLSENIKAIRKSKGLSQQELAIKLNVVRQTVSKWEQGRSVPDSDLLIALSDVLETPISTLLGEPVIEPEADALKAVSEKLEVVNLQLARRTAMRRNALHWAFILAGAVVVMVFVVLVGLAALTPIGITATLKPPFSERRSTRSNGSSSDWRRSLLWERSVEPS